MAKKDDGYLGDDNEGRIQYLKLQEAKKAMRGDNMPNLLQQFMKMIKNAPNKSPNTAKAAALKKAAAARAAKKSPIPPSPTR